jgi:hypothetical protein
LPSRSPTTVLIWARARRIALSLTGFRLQSENLPTVVFEELLEPEEGEDEGREDRGEPDDDRRCDPRPDAFDVEPVRKQVRDQQREKRGDQGARLYPASG